MSANRKGLAGLDSLINGKGARARRSPTLSPNDALVQVASTAPGEEIRIRIVRNGSRETLTATTAERPAARRRQR